MTDFKIGDKVYAFMIEIASLYPWSTPTIDTLTLVEWTILGVFDNKKTKSYRKPYLLLEHAPNSLLGPRQVPFDDCFKTREGALQAFMDKLERIKND